MSLRLADRLARLGTETALAVCAEAARYVQQGRRVCPFHLGDMNIKTPDNVIANYQACPEDEGFTASAAIRMGVAEMSRFGMKEEDFGTVAQFIRDVVVDNNTGEHDVAVFRQKFAAMQYGFDDGQIGTLLQEIPKNLSRFRSPCLSVGPVAVEFWFDGARACDLHCPDGFRPFWSPKNRST